MPRRGFDSKYMSDLRRRKIEIANEAARTGKSHPRYRPPEREVAENRLHISQHLGQNVAVSYVCKLRDVKPLEKLVLIAISRYWRIDEKYICISYRRLAAFTSLSRRTVIRVVRELERRGLLYVYRSLGGKRVEETVYRLDFLNPTKTGDGETPQELWERVREDNFALLQCDSKGSPEDVRRRLAESYRQELLGLMSQEVREWDSHPQWKMGQAERRIYNLLEEVGDDGLKVKGTRCVMVTKSRKYNCRRCPHPAVYGRLCRMHFNMFIVSKPAKQLNIRLPDGYKPPKGYEPPEPITPVSLELDI